ncbi:MAG: Mrp/NBP35 family ATP-binding protein [Ruminococcaceae bacterium]|nr:Mrp/NBP35 family ATP-binding protein [Oscillospiraceae bacterium]
MSNEHENCTHDCSTCKSNCSSRDPKSLIEKPNELSSIKKVIAIVSGKGGVGKSLVTSMMATLTNRKGFKTAVLDADITGPSIPKAFGITEHATGDGENHIIPVTTKTGIDIMSLNLLTETDTTPVVWRGPVIAGAVKQFWTDVIWKDVDYMYVDMPPGTGDVPLTVFQSLPVDGIIIVTSPQELVGMIVEKAVNMAKMMNIPILGLVENMSYIECPDCGKKINVFGESHIEEIAAKHGLEVLGKIPMDPKLAAACDAGKIEDFENHSLDDANAKVLKVFGI